MINSSLISLLSEEIQSLWNDKISGDKFVNPSLLEN